MENLSYTLEDLKHLQELELKILKEVASICEAHDLTYYAYAGTALGAIRHEGFIPWDNDMDIAMFRDDYEKLLKIMETELSDEYYLIHFCNHEDCFFPIARVYLKGTKFQHRKPWNVSYDDGIKIDIFPLDNIHKSKIKRIIYYTKLDFYNQLLMNSLFEINSPNKFVSFAHSLMHHILKIIPIKTIKKRYIKCQTKYNKEKTDYTTVFDFKYNYFYKEDFESPEKVKFEDFEIIIFNGYDRVLTQIYGDYMTLPPEGERYNDDYIFDFGKY